MINRFTVMGRFTADPEVKTSVGELPFTKFSLAVPRNFSDKSGNYKTDFFYFIAWRNEATFIGKHFKKGDAILIEGMMQTNQFTDKEGNKRTAYEVLVENAFFPGNVKATSSERSINTSEENGYEDIPYGDAPPIQSDINGGM